MHLYHGSVESVLRDDEKERQNVRLDTESCEFVLLTGASLTGLPVTLPLLAR